ncbi:MAG: serine/threonine-protein kinase [Chloroflexota bacterium]
MNELQNTRFAPGQKVDQYVLEDQIATGGMGQVFLAYQESMNRQVAIKFLPEVDSDNPDTVARFEREVFMVTRLEHPHIVPVYGFGSEYGMPFIVMRHMSGGTLREYFQQGKLNLERILKVVDQIVIALDYAHEQGIIHRDLKPSNIFLDERQNAYLADFGLAKPVSGSYDLTRTDEGISGTPEYMSPEQVRGMKLDGRTDIYSLGIIVFQLLVGHPPFSGQNPMETVLKQISDSVPSVSALQPDLPREIDQVFYKVLSKEVDERYQTGREFAADLNKILFPVRLTWVPYISDGVPEITKENNTIPADGGERTEKGVTADKEDIEQDDPTVKTIERPPAFNWNINYRLLLFLFLALVLVGGMAYAVYSYWVSINNPVSQLTVHPVSIVASPRDIEVDIEGNVWVIAHDTEEVIKLRTDCEEDESLCGSILSEVEIGSRPLFIIPTETELLIGRQLSQGLTGVSLDGSVTRTIDFPYVPADAVVYGDSIWITTGQDLIELTIEGEELSTFSAGSVAGALYRVNDFIWVALEGEGRLRRFNLVTRDFDLDVPLSVEANQLISLDGDSTGSVIWATFNRSNQLIALDSNTGELLQSVRTGSLPLDIDIHNNKVWLVTRDENEIAAHQQASGSYIGGLEGVEKPSTMVVEDCGSNCAFLWVASESTGIIHRIDISNLE